MSKVSDSLTGRSRKYSASTWRDDSLIILTLSIFTLLVLAKSGATNVFEQGVCMVSTVQPVCMLKISSGGTSWPAVIANAFGTRNTSGNPEPAMIDNHTLDRISHQHSFLATQRHSLLTICLSPKISAPHSGQNLGTNAPMSPKPMYSQSRPCHPQSEHSKKPSFID